MSSTIVELMQDLRTAEREVEQTKQIRGITPEELSRKVVEKEEKVKEIKNTIKVTPATTRADLYGLPQLEFIRRIKEAKDDPEKQAELDRIIGITPEVMEKQLEEKAAKEAADQAAKEAADKVVADAASAEVARVSAEIEVARKATEVTTKPWETEDASYATYGIHVTRDTEGKIQRIVQEYQVKDESGNPIGRATHLEAKSWPEFIAKKDECHVQATRAFNRLKSQKVSFKQQQPAEPEYKPVTDEDMAALLKDLKGDDATKAVAAARKIAGSEVAKDRQAAREAEIKAQGQAIGYEFMKRHVHDFNPCKANSDLIGQWLEENNLEFTLDNLELALIAKENELAPVSVPASRVEVPPVVNPPATVPQALPAVQHPSAELAARQAAAAAPPAAPVPPAPQPVAENMLPVQSRPGINGGLEPGSLSAQRPTVTNQPKYTKEAILKMDKEQLKRLVKDPKSRAEINAVLAQPR